LGPNVPFSSERASALRARSLLAAENATAPQEDVAMKPSVKNVLAVDVGGSSVKISASGQSERRSFSSGPTLTPRQMVPEVKKLAGDWMCKLIGYPGPVLRGRPIAEPYNLGRGWVGFDFGRAFGCAVKVVNDAAM
jgi:polyphosphate glucokinase